MTKKEVLTFVLLVCLAVSCFIFGATSDPWDGTTWDVTAPDIDQPHGNTYKEIYDLRKGIALRMNKEHETLATSSAGGVHKQGSARAFFQDAAPTTQIDGTAWDSGDTGSLWFDTNAAIDNQFYVLTNHASTGTWTPVSTEIIAFLLASNRQFAGTLGCDGAFTATGLITANSGVTLGAGDDLIGSSTSDITINSTKFTVAGATGNTSVGGTFESVGIATLADTSVTKTTAAPGADAQIANKKYVDTGADAMHDAEGGYNNVDVDGTKTKVYTKYFSGLIDADSETLVAHGISNGLTKIFHISAACYDGTDTWYVSDYAAGSTATSTFYLQFDATNVILTGVGSILQGGSPYRIKIDYTL